MIRFGLCLGAAIVAFPGLCLPASAQIMVPGPGPEVQCFEAASAQRATAAAFKACDMALGNILLPDEDRAGTYVNRSALHLGRRNWASALSDTDAALSLQPDLAAAFVNRSAALYMLRRYAEARAAGDKALPLARGIEVQRALFNRAMASEALGDPASAYKDLKRALDLDPAFAEAQTELARFEVVR
jgi:tetratricopeptide (TPR) repeat protein